jgi:restriction system protein
MTVPGYQEYMTPMLRLLSDGQTLHINEISDRLARYFSLTEEDLSEMIPSGRKSRHVDRVGWAATYMKQAELLTKPERGLYQLSHRGYEVVRSGQTVNSAFLARFTEFQAFKARTRQSNDNSMIAPVIEDMTEEIHTPDETMEASYLKLRSTLAADLLERLKEGSPRFFEQAVIDLLLAMGYGGSRREAARRVGQSGDGGIDGTINEDRLGLDVVYIQAKRWANSVGARDVRDFAGSLEERKALKGVFITTSDFTRDARDFVERIGKRIVLIDGERLAGLMIDFNVGVTARETYVIKKIDEDYFSGE